MADIYKGELQDNLGNTVYPHTEADVVFCADGKTAQEKLAGYENALGSVTGTSSSLEVGNADILATTEATKKLNDSLGGLDIRYNSETGKPEWKERGADTFNPFSSDPLQQGYYVTNQQTTPTALPDTNKINFSSTNHLIAFVNVEGMGFTSVSVTNINYLAMIYSDGSMYYVSGGARDITENVKYIIFARQYSTNPATATITFS